MANMTVSADIEIDSIENSDKLPIITLIICNGKILDGVSTSAILQGHLQSSCLLVGALHLQELD